MCVIHEQLLSLAFRDHDPKCSIKFVLTRKRGANEQLLVAISFFGKLLGVSAPFLENGLTKNITCYADLNAEI